MPATSAVPPPRLRRAAAALAAGIAVAVLPGTSGLAAPGTASGAPTSATAAAAALTVTPNPSYRSARPFEGWGTSLVWFANATGDYPSALREELYDKVFGPDGLDLTVARYNIGGGSAVDVDPSYLRQGAAVEGWWNPDLDGDGDADEATLANRDAYRAAWDPDDDASYDLDADSTQRWWVERLAADGQITRWEAFSNSPPFFMTVNGYVTGGFDATTDQLRADSVDAFAAYLTRSVEHLEDSYGIEVRTIDPMNEPNTDYWRTSFTADGDLACCRQEGAHLGPPLQAQLIEALAARLADPGTTTDAVVSAPDETTPGTFVADWYGWTEAARDAVGQLNVHTYGTDRRVEVRDIAKASGTPLWMSEVEGDWTGSRGLDLTDMDNGLGIAAHIVDDLRELEPSAWVLWQPVEDLWNMEVTERRNWGSIYVDFDCDAAGRSARRVAAGSPDPSCRVLTNTKYNTLRNFTHYIRPGDWLVPTDDPATTAAVRGDGTGATLVHVNTTATGRDVVVDLSHFGTVGPGATVTPVVTTQPPAGDLEANALVEGAPVAVDPASATATVAVPASSVTTLVVDGVHGVATDAAPADGSPMLLEGVGSGRLLSAAVDPAATPATTIEDPAATAGESARQTWTLHTLTGAGTSERTVAVTSGDGRLLAARAGHATALVESDLATAATTPSQQWLLNTLDGRTYSLLNVATAEQLDVVGEAVGAGSAVGTWAGSTGGHQRWRLVDAASEPAHTLTARHSGKLASVAAAAGDGGAVTQQQASGGAGQHWHLRDAGDGYVTVVSVATGRCLDVSGGPPATADGVPVVQWTCHGGSNQQWRVEDRGDYVSLVARHSGRCLDVPGAATADGVQLVQWTCHGGSNQQWRLQQR